MCPCGKKGAQQCHRGEKAPGFSWIVGGAEGAASVQCGQHQAQQDLINTHKYLRGRNEDEGVRLFAVLPPDRTRGNGHKLNHMKFQRKFLEELSNTGVSFQKSHGMSACGDT